jgi:hypothetical protein
MEINTLPTELLEQIFENITYERKCVQRAKFRQIALVCKRWSAIIIPMIWKEMEITGSLRIEKSTAFSFYRHIINPNCEWGRYIQALKLHDAPFWPICMAKLLTACPYIVNLSIISYRPVGSKKVDLLEHILRVLPNLGRLDLSRSHHYFGEDNIQQVINNRKDLYIKATRICPQSKGKNHIPWMYVSEEYDGKKWNCPYCKSGKYDK